jgi:radical SAM superfamily enzyme YgiQ (UPF0313 family)
MAKILLFTVYDHVGLGIRILASHLQNNGHEAHVLFFKKHKSMPVLNQNKKNTTYEYLYDGKIHNSCFDVAPWTKEEVRLLTQKIQEVDPDIVGIGSRSTLDDANIELLHELKAHFPEKLFLAGGFGPSLRPEAYLAVCDFVCFGESEASLLEVMRRYPDRERMKEIGGIGYMQNGALQVVTPVFENFHLDAYPFPLYGQDVSFIDNNKLVDDDVAMQERVYYTLLGRGCIADCTYCCSSQWSNMYKNWGCNFPKRRNRSIDNMIEELVRARELGFVGICFCDTYLVASTKQMLELFTRIRTEVGLPFDAHLHLEQMVNHPELLDAAIEAGLGTTTIGIQSGCERVARDIYHRKVSNDLMLRAAHLFLQKGLNVNYATIEGNPLTTDEDFEEHLAFMGQIPFEVDRCLLCIHKLKNLPNTPLTKSIEAQGLLEADVSQWHYRGVLTTARVLLDDADFALLRQSPLLRERPELFSELYNRFVVDACIRNKEIVYKSELLEPVYRHHLERFRDKEIIVWWSEELYETYRGLFLQHNVKALINSDPKFHGDVHDGVAITGPSFLADKKEIPVFICSPHKRAIVKRIQTEYSPGHLLF